MKKIMRDWTWEQLRDVWNRADPEWAAWCDDRDFEMARILRDTPQKYKKALAAAFSMLKWEPRAKHRGAGPCGLCIQYWDWEDGDVESCPACPLDQAGAGCLGMDFEMFSDACDDIKNNRILTPDADKFYWKLAEVYRKEWEKI